MKKLTRNSWVAGLLLVAGSAGFGVIHAAQHKPTFDPGDWAAASPATLAQLRGGFEVGQGLTVSFGLTRTVSINGDLVNQSSFNIPDIAHLTPAQTAAASAAMAKAGLTIQNGAQNQVEHSLNPDPSRQTPGSLIIQNSLNNQNILTRTVINTEVNSLTLLKTINTQTVLKEAILGALGVR